GFQLLNAMGQAEADDLGLEGGPLYDPLGTYRRVAGNWSDWSTPRRTGPTATSTATPQEQPGAPALPVATITPAPPSAASTILVSEPLPSLTVRSAGVWRIQLGAFATRGAAQALFTRLGSSLGEVEPYFIPEGAVIRLQAGPYTSRADAAQACVRLKPQPCFTVTAN
ncbi:MAG TPA: SPOR domain-containing protein, partial [Sphingomicrobium sp.]|nr:SPOR domain-containing protein [Sphingomicrobium sp.]